MVRVSVIGAGGYTGLELVKMFSRHKNVEISCLVGDSTAGKKFSGLYPAMSGICDIELSGINEPSGRNSLDYVAENSDAAFLCLPHGASMDAAAELLKRGVKVFDLSADYRVNNQDLYEKTYKTQHKYPELLAEAVYGLAEIFTDDIKKADLVAVPGCYPTSVLIPLIPLIREKLIDSSLLIADSKSGVSGAGKKPTETTHFCEANEDFKPYGIMSHRHKPEIDHIIARAAGVDTQVVFTPHLAPMTRGMISTIYTATTAHKDDLLAAWHKAYADKPFVRIREDITPAVKYVANTGYVDIALYRDSNASGANVIMVSALDNLMKGASSQAVQCFNLRMGFDEREGISSA